jgi:glucose/arabinose dehydrogenase
MAVHRSLRAAARAAGLLAALAGGLILAGGPAGAAGGGVGDGRGGVRLHRVGSFDRPLQVASAPGVRGTIYVVQRAGKVILVHGDNRHKFLDVSGRTTADGERGLLSMAFDPNFSRNGLVYLCYTTNGGDIEVDSFRASRHRARGSSRRRVIAVNAPDSEHFGGQIHFGPEGDLYLGTGDGDAEGDPNHYAQDKGMLLGKLLRIIPKRHGTHRYLVPNTNPFVGRHGADEIFALGFRNPFRWSFDGRRIAIGDVGQDSWEEVDYETHRSLRGANFGWNHFEGTHVYDNSIPAPSHHSEAPIFEYQHFPGCAVMGGYVVRDRALRSLYGRYLYADWCTGKLRSFIPRLDHARDEKASGLQVDEPSGFGVAHGHLYVASLAGPVYRLVHR